MNRLDSGELRETAINTIDETLNDTVFFDSIKNYQFIRRSTSAFDLLLNLKGNEVSAAELDLLFRTIKKFAHFYYLEIHGRKLFFKCCV